MAKVHALLHNWESNFFSCTERIELVKSMILPQFLFLFQTLPIDLKPSMVKKWQALLNSFIWEAKHPRIGFTHLNKPASLGGIGFPDLYTYYKVAQLHPLYSLPKSEQLYGWMQIEESFVTCFFKKDVIWNKHNDRPKLIESNP